MDLAPGEVLAPSRLAAARRWLYDIGVFSRVSVDVVGDEDRVQDVVVEVSEKPSLYAEAGGGVATDEGAKVFLRGGHRDLWGLAHRLTLLGQAGIGWVGDGWQLAWQEPEWKAALRYEAPGVPSPGEKSRGRRAHQRAAAAAALPALSHRRRGGLLLRVGARGGPRWATAYSSAGSSTWTPGCSCRATPGSTSCR